MNPEETTSIPAGVYFPRRLSIKDSSLLDKQVDEDGFLTFAGNTVVLGEPGMGKSELMRELARRLEIQPVTAIRFINAKNPATLIPAGKPIFIDGLDEAMARREGDAVDRILAQLEEAGAPRFVLSCRSREWQARTLTTLRQLYGADPRILTLEPFHRAEAESFLSARHPSVNAAHVFEHLTRHGLEELYRNPLTLGLIGRVAETDIYLPQTRANLFDRVCTLIWPEHDPDRQNEGLAQLTENEALDAAGAIASGLLFAGSEAASSLGAGQVQQGDQRLVELETLPGGRAARPVFSSKLFHSVGPSRAKLIHRVVAEYLGARWLARQAARPRTQRRLLSQLQGSGGVPTSLRGLHAWLAYHSSTMAERIIAGDPYGVLRYGESALLTPHLANCLFEALSLLAKDDPYFRAADWDSKTAVGLMIPTLKLKISEIIISPSGNAHLRSLLIEGLEGRPLAAELVDILEMIVFSTQRFYREREDAAKALFPHRNRAWWQETIEKLTGQEDIESSRLARQLIQKIDVDVSDKLLVATLFAEMGLTSCGLSRRAKRHNSTLASYDRLYAAIPSARLAGILDLIVDHADMLLRDDRELSGRVADFTANLLIRGIGERLIEPPDASSLWRWLKISHDASRRLQLALAKQLGDQGELRRAVQTHVLANCRGTHSLRVTEFHLRERLVGLGARPEDIVCALERIAKGNNKNRALRRDWKDLINIAWGTDGLHPDVQAAEEKFRCDDKALADFLCRLRHPKTAPWELRRQREATNRERKRKVDFETARRDLDKRRYDLRDGVMAAIILPAQVYFDLHPDLSSELPPSERLASWIGLDLRDDALSGFEAVLHRTDLPEPAEIANDLAGSSNNNYGFPIMAGLYERLRSNRSIVDLPKPVKEAALLLTYDDHGWSLSKEKEAMRAELEAEVIATPKAREAFARLWIEPALAVGKEHVTGLYKLAHDPEWQSTGAVLATEWLTAFPHVPESVDAWLIDCLTYGGALDALAAIAEARNLKVFNNFDHMLSWLAVDVLVRFDLVQSQLVGIGAECRDFIWFLRNRLQLGRRGAMLSLKVAQAEWILTEFREQWPYAVLEGTGSGDTNDYDATDFLRSLINRIATETTAEANEAMGRLVAGPADSYANLIRHMAAEQRQKRAEESFSALTPGNLATLLDDGPPGNIEDLKVLVLEELHVAQCKLIGDDLDCVRDFWTDSGIPRGENRCRDRLVEIISPELARYDIQRITEADMPKTKRADIAFSRGLMQLPVEVKGQWHIDVWDAATGQLDVKYLIDWRSEQRGVYCVLWFGDLPSASKRRLKAHPDKLAPPASAEEMRIMLIDRVPEARRAFIDVVVLDFTSGKHDSTSSPPPSS